MIILNMKVMVIEIEAYHWTNILEKLNFARGIQFISSKFVVKERVMHSKSNNIKVKSYNDENGVVNELFESLQWIYQGNLKTSMR